MNDIYNQETKYYLEYCTRQGRIKYIGFEADYGFCKVPQLMPKAVAEAVMDGLKDIYPSYAKRTTIKEAKGNSNEH